jgi:hypothetical protein
MFNGDTYALLNVAPPSRGFDDAVRAALDVTFSAMRRPAVAAALLALLALAVRSALRTRRAIARIQNLEDKTVIDDDGAVRSIQSADVILPADELAKLWSPENLERLARTYWRFLTRVTLGVIRVKYTERERFVCLLFRPFVLLSFQAPEYLDVRLLDEDEYGRAKLRIEVEVANFYPAIAHGLSRWLYANTQSRIHVLVTYGFLRSLANLDLAESRVGRFAPMEQMPDPGSPGASAEATRQRLAN